MYVSDMCIPWDQVCYTIEAQITHDREHFNVHSIIMAGHELHPYSYMHMSATQVT